MSDVAAPPPERPGLMLKIRGHLSLSRVQAVFGIIAALLSIGGTLGYLSWSKPNTGELVAILQDARSGKPVGDATVELLTPKDAIVTTLNATSGEARQRVKEGPYRLRVTHPHYGVDVRPIQVIAGQTAEIRFRLAPRAAGGSPALTPAEKALSEGVDTIKKIFR